MVPLMINEVRRLSQSEGLFDDEIAEILSFSRATVNRARHSHEIPRVNLDNRMDKHYVCIKCQREVWVRRKDHLRRICPECRGIKAKKEELSLTTTQAREYLRNKVLSDCDIELQ